MQYAAEQPKLQIASRKVPVSIVMTVACSLCVQW